MIVEIIAYAILLSLILVMLYIAMSRPIKKYECNSIYLRHHVNDFGELKKAKVILYQNNYHLLLQYKDTNILINDALPDDLKLACNIASEYIHEVCQTKIKNVQSTYDGGCTINII